jgi:transcriptional regulator with XRE-family HTH domain
MSITTAQIRGARGILNWSQSDLAERTGISATSIGSIENNQSTPRESTLKAIRQAFEKNGIEFLGLEGVRLQSNYVRTLYGEDGFSAFLDDVYHTAVTHGSKTKPVQIYLSNVVHENWVKWMGPEKWSNHARRMIDSKDVMDVRILVKEGDWNFPAADYAQYKWVPNEIFNDKSFYSYHDKLAFLNFKDKEVEIVIIKQSDFAEGYRNLFLIAWDHAAKAPSKEIKVLKGNK